MGDNLKVKLIKKLKKEQNKTMRLKKQVLELRKDLSLDYTTGIINKRQGTMSLKREIERSKKYNKPVTITFIDVDNLGEINDNFGHFSGDLLLNNVASIIKDSIRKGDFVYRYGGDEFIAVFSDTKIDEAKEIWKRIQFKIQEKNNTNKFPFKISLSAGFAEYKSNIKLNEFIRYADINMYKNKGIKKEK